MTNQNLDTSLKILRFIEDGNSITQEDSGQLINRAVISHIADIQNLTLDQLADDTFLSDASASRYFKRKGFPSYTTFKNAFIKFMMEQQVAIIKNSYIGRDEKEKFSIQMDDELAEIMNIAGRSYKNAAKILLQCDHVVFAGEMYDIHPFFPLQVILLCSSRAAYLCRTNELKTFPDRILKGNVVIVAVSHTKENTENINQLKDRLGSAFVISFGTDRTLDPDVVIPSIEKNRFTDRSMVIPMQVKCLLEEYINISGMRR